MPLHHKAPHLGRTVLIAPTRRVNLAQAGHPLVTIVPRTRLGAVALNLAVASSTATLQIIATSTYVNALTALVPPVITFRAPPPGTSIPVQDLQTAYDNFTRQLAALQDHAAAWIGTSAGSGGPSIFSNLIAIANMVGNIDATVQSDFVLLQTLTSGSPAWQYALTQVRALIGAEVNPLTSVESRISALCSNLDTAASTLTTAASTGVLGRLQAAYQSQINALNQFITDCNNQISSDNSKIIGLGFAAGATVVVGIIGLANFWNPIGWIMIAGGAAGAYFAIAEIAALKGQIVRFKAQVESDFNWVDADQTAAQAVAAFAQSARGVAIMNSAAQQELNTLLLLCKTLSGDIQTALTGLDQDQLTPALMEWNEIVASAAFLAGITAYVWPSSIMLANPRNLAAARNNAWLVSNCGITFNYTSGGKSWSALPGMSLSIVAAGSVVAGIDGAPNEGSQIDPTTYGQSFLVKTYAADNHAWTNISTFPAAQVATDGISIWAVSQVTSDRQVYKYDGSGTSWTALGAMPNGDAPAAIVAAGGTLAAIANNGGGLWINRRSGWQQIGTATYSTITANGGQIGLIDTSGNGWVLDTANDNALTASMTGISNVAQAPSGDQYVTDGILNLWHVGFPQGGGSAVSTQLRSNIVGVTVSDGGTVYALDNAGNIWALINLANNSWQQLPDLPGS